MPPPATARRRPAPAAPAFAAAVEAELQKMTAVKRLNGEDEQTYLDRLMRASSALPDAKYAKLSEDAQAWNAAAVDASDNEAALPGFARGAAAAPAGRRPAPAAAAEADAGDDLDEPGDEDAAAEELPAEEVDDLLEEEAEPVPAPAPRRAGKAAAPAATAVPDAAFRAKVIAVLRSLA